MLYAQLAVRAQTSTAAGAVEYAFAMPSDRTDATRGLEQGWGEGILSRAGGFGAGLAASFTTVRDPPGTHESARRPGLAQLDYGVGEVFYLPHTQ